MRPAPAALVNWLSTSNLLTAFDLWTFQLSGGEILRYSGASIPLVIPGSCWAANAGGLNAGQGSLTFALGPVFKRGRVKCKIGVDPQPLQVEIGATAGDLIGTLTWQQAIYGRLFDGATVELDRFFPGPAGPTDTSLGCIVWYYGAVGQIDWGRSAIRMTVNNPLGQMANAQFPRRIYGANCTHVFGAPMCGYNRATGQSQGNPGAAAGNGPAAFVATAQSGTTQNVIAGGLSNLSYIEGTLTGLAGANADLVRTIRNIDLSGNITLYSPFLYPIAPGDTFTALPGCDHTVGTCQNVFQNLNRFGGMPFIPPPESIV